MLQFFNGQQYIIEIIFKKSKGIYLIVTNILLLFNVFLYIYVNLE